MPELTVDPFDENQAIDSEGELAGAVRIRLFTDEGPPSREDMDNAPIVGYASLSELDEAFRRRSA